MHVRVRQGLLSAGHATAIRGAAKTMCVHGPGKTRTRSLAAAADPPVGSSGYCEPADPCAFLHRGGVPGGVHSPVRSFAAVGGGPAFIAKAQGAYIIDKNKKAKI